MNVWQSKSAFLLFLLLAAVYFRILSRKSKQSASLQFSGSLGLDTKQVKTFRTRLLGLPLFLKTLGIAFAILALARPQEANTKVKKNIEGIDIIIALDISDSMQIEDMKPLNRLEAAKDTIRKFIEKRTSDRIGLVVFAGEAFTMVPLTMDYQMILGRVNEITTASEAHVKDGTAIGVALANAASRLKDSTAKTRIVIFATDGENNSGTIDPETGLDIAKGYGLKIYSIGMGRDGPTRLPIYQKDVFGQKIKTYQPFESTVNEELLKRFANETGGKFYRASKEDSLQGVFADINNLEKTKIDVSKYTRYTENFQKYLLPGLLLYLLGIFLGQTWLRRVP